MALFGGAVGKDTLSRVWRKVKADWEAWNARSLAEEPIVRLIFKRSRIDKHNRHLLRAGADSSLAEQTMRSEVFQTSR